MYAQFCTFYIIKDSVTRDIEMDGNLSAPIARQIHLPLKRLSCLPYLAAFDSHSGSSPARDIVVMHLISHVKVQLAHHISRNLGQGD